MAADWKTKYLDIRSKLLRATDTAYRLGFEEGMKASQQQQVMQQQQEQAALEAAAAQGQIPPGQEGEIPPEAQGGGEMPPEAMEGEMAPMQIPEEEMDEGTGSELDQHIDELSSLVAKGEKPSVVSLRKTVSKIADIRKSQKSRKKVENTLVPSQKRFVDNILKKWEKEAKSEDELESVLKEHGIELED